MSVKQDAVAAAKVAHPDAMKRTPYAQGYQAGHAAGVIAGREQVAEYLRLVGHSIPVDLALAQLRVRDSFRGTDED